MPDAVIEPYHSSESPIAGTPHKRSSSFYAVAAGRKIGIFTSWATAQQSTDRYSSAMHKRFDDLEAATAYMKNHLGATHSPTLYTDDVPNFDTSENEVFLNLSSNDQSSTPNPNRSVSGVPPSSVTSLPQNDMRLDELTVSLNQLNSTLTTLNQTLLNLPLLLTQSQKDLSHSILNGFSDSAMLPIVSAISNISTPLTCLNDRLSSIDMLLDPDTQRVSPKKLVTSHQRQNNFSLTGHGLGQKSDDPGKADHGLEQDQLACRPHEVNQQVPLNKPTGSSTASPATSIQSVSQPQGVKHQDPPNQLTGSNIASPATRNSQQKTELDLNQITRPGQSNAAKHVIPRSHYKNRRPTIFEPEKCIVISSTDKEYIKSLNQDIIRCSINKHFGPVIIDMVTRYKFYSGSPKYIIQFKNETTAKDVVEKWSEHILQGSDARLTQKPSQHIGMMKFVPLNISDDMLTADINAVYPTAKAYRLHALDGSPLRTVKITFSAGEDLTSSIENGMLLKTTNLLCRVEKPYADATLTTTPQTQDG